MTQPMDPPATRDSWRIEPPGTMKEIPFDVEFTAQEFRTISHGLVPHDMQDKWFAFVEDGSLFLHRSWTGIRIFAVTFEPTVGGFRASKAEVLSDPASYRAGDDRSEAVHLEQLIRNLLLRAGPR